MSGQEREARSPGRRLHDRLEGSEISSGSKYYDLMNPAVKAAWERLAAEIDKEMSGLGVRLNDAERDREQAQAALAAREEPQEEECRVCHGADPDCIVCTKGQVVGHDLAAREDTERPDDDAFCFGPRKIAATGANCCGKPIGCTNTNPGCLYLRHPWKREHVKALRDTEQEPKR